MKIIISENYKKSKFEGQVLTPQEEDEWVEEIIKREEELKKTPAPKDSPRRGRGRGHNRRVVPRIRNMKREKMEDDYLKEKNKPDLFFEQYGRNL